LRGAGITLLATATNPHEAETIANAGIHAIVAQGHEAGGHRGIFNPAEPDSELGTVALTRLLARQSPIPVIAAGGIMDGAGIAAALHLGAIAAQLGTAFIACPESLADAAYHAALASDAAYHTVITAGISGRPARCLANDFTRLTAAIPPAQIPTYPRAYAAGKALTAAAKPHAPTAYAPHWAGQSAPLARTLPAADLVKLLVEELRAG
jgi:nitronate monooxygenase